MLGESVRPDQLVVMVGGSGIRNWNGQSYIKRGSWHIQQRNAQEYTPAVGIYGNVVIAKACRTEEDLRTESVLAGLIAAFTM